AAASTPVVLASDQSNVPVTVSNFPATQPVSGTVSVGNFPATQAVSGTVAVTGVATETTLGTRLADSTFTTRINTQGQKNMAGSTPVVLASDQSAVPVSIGSTVAVTDNNGSLTVDSTQLPASLGAKTTANSLAVNIASDQTVPVTSRGAAKGTTT